MSRAFFDDFLGGRLWYVSTVMKTLALSLMIAAMARPAAAPAGFELWKSSELRAFESKLAPKMNAHKIALEPLGSYGNHSAIMLHREGDGEAELHETQNDLIVIESGEATLVVGGSIVDPRTSAPHEIRGASIRGGERRALAAGDILHIPIGVPHQMLVAAGKQITYFAVKINGR
jgi:mannose-6-phosphate isomerase-like protein (cupin superfamily)